MPPPTARGEQSKPTHRPCVADPRLPPTVDARRALPDRCPGRQAAVEPGGRRPASLDELEVSNELSVFARYREIEERSLSGSKLQDRLGVSCQRLGHLRKEKRLLGLRLPIHREIY
jgi:hypothetical protein